MKPLLDKIFVYILGFDLSEDSVSYFGWCIEFLLTFLQVVPMTKVLL